MILKVFDKQEAKTEKPVFLRLTQDGKDVFLGACDKQGNIISAILVIRADGSIGRAGGVVPGLGFSLDVGNRVEID